MITVPDPKELVDRIRRVQTEKKYTIDEVVTLMESKGYYPLGTATISRLINGVNEAASYDYIKSIIPVYNTLIDDIKDEDQKIEAMQVLLDYKLECIDNLKEQLDSIESMHEREITEIKEKYRMKLEDETSKFQEIMEFRSNQITLKDERITQLINIVKKLTEHMIECPYRRKGSGDGE